MNRDFPQKKPKTLHPRRVRGGERMKREPAELNENWAAARLVRLFEASTAGPSLVEGAEYARGGQTKTLEISEGQIRAAVQGRSTRPYQVWMRLASFESEQWDEVLKAMTDQARYAAMMLAGELPPNIEDVFAPLGLRLFPASASEFEVSCNCDEEDKPWCKHAVCVGYLIAERLASDPFLIFALRGRGTETLLEGLRQGREVAALDEGWVPVYAGVPAGAAEWSKGFGENLDRFWKAGAQLDLVELPIEKPAVSHPLLRRLGPSPFKEAKFPLVGLLATCYEVISESAIGGWGGSGGGGDEGGRGNSGDVPLVSD